MDKLIILVLLFNINLAEARGKNEFWNYECLKRELPPCGKENLPPSGKFTEEQSKIFVCRLRALAKCKAVLDRLSQVELVLYQCLAITDNFTDKVNEISAELKESES